MIGKFKMMNSKKNHHSSGHHSRDIVTAVHQDTGVMTMSAGEQPLYAVTVGKV